MTPPAAGAAPEAQTHYATDLTVNLDAKVGMSPTDLFTALAQDRFAARDGARDPFSPSDVAADIQAGQPPTPAIAARGRFDTAAIDTLFHDNGTWKADLTTPTYHGHRLYRWSDDLKQDLSKVNTGLLTDLGQSRRIAFPDPSTFLFSRDDATMHALLDVTDHATRSLDSDPAHHRVAAALDDHGVYSALILGTQAASGSAAPSRQGSTAPGLRPYLLAGIGEALDHGQPRTVIVLAHADAAAAAANATAMRTLITSGMSAQSGKPWSSWFRIESVAAVGTLTVAVLVPENVALWSRMAEARDSLLAIG